MLDLKSSSAPGDVVDFDQARISSADREGHSCHRASRCPTPRWIGSSTAICERDPGPLRRLLPQRRERPGHRREAPGARGALRGRQGLHPLPRRAPDARATQRATQAVEDAHLGKLTVVKRDGRTRAVQRPRRRGRRPRARPRGSTARRRRSTSWSARSLNNVYDGIPTEQIEQAHGAGRGGLHRARPGLQPRRRAAAAAEAVQGGRRPLAARRRARRAYRAGVRRRHPARRRPRPLRRRAWASSTSTASPAALRARARPGLPVPRPPDARTSATSRAHGEPPVELPQALLDARRDGPGDRRGRPRRRGRSSSTT